MDSPRGSRERREARMALWEMIKKGAEEGLEALKEGVNLFLSEAGKTSRILKKRMELSSVQSSVRKTFTRLGSLVYDLHSQGEERVYDREEVKTLIAQIDGYQAKVQKIEGEIEALKREEGRKMSPRSSQIDSQLPANPAN